MHTGSPIVLRRHNEVDVVLQFEQDSPTRRDALYIYHSCIEIEKTKMLVVSGVDFNQPRIFVSFFFFLVSVNKFVLFFCVFASTILCVVELKEI